MDSLFKFLSIICCVTIVGSRGANLPSGITPCTFNLPSEQLSNCIAAQARNALPTFAKGIPELNLESLDPLTLTDISAKAGTFNVKSTNVKVKGLSKVDIKETKWDFAKNVGQLRIFGNLTFLSDYQTDGRLLLISINGNGKLTVKMYDTEILIKYKIRRFKGEDGMEHIETYDAKPSQNYGNVKIHMSNILGGDVIGDTVNQVMNENWREIMAEVGPPYVKAVSNKVHEIINKLYAQVSLDQLFKL